MYYNTNVIFIESTLGMFLRAVMALKGHLNCDHESRSWSKHEDYIYDLYCYVVFNLYFLKSSCALDLRLDRLMNFLSDSSFFILTGYTSAFIA